MNEPLTPAAIVAELSRYIVGQEAAKKAVAIALRNRWRRQQLPPEVQKEVMPANIILIGPTGVGKTEIARRLARLANAPFVKVEASKFTEVGYVGRDVDSIVRDLVEAAVALVREEKAAKVRVAAQRAAEERLIELLMPKGASDPEETRRSLKRLLREGQLEKQEVELEVTENRAPNIAFLGGQGLESLELSLREAFGPLFAQRAQRRVTVAEARKILETEELERLLDKAEIEREAVRRAQESGIVFFWTKLTRSPPGELPPPVLTCPGKGCSGTCCPWWRAPPSTPATGRWPPTTCCSLPPGHFTWPSPRI